MDNPSTGDSAQRYFDQVVRWQAFVADHPDVHIEHQTAPMWHWLASWVDARGDEQHLVDHELRGLLDRLEQVIPPT